MVSIAISASRAGATCAVRKDDGSVVTPDGPPARGAQLTAEVARLLQEEGLDRSAVRALRLDLGPGSYTGLRVAVTFARFLSRFGNRVTAGEEITIETVTSFELVAATLRAAGQRGTVRIALDARRGRVHRCDLNCGDDAVELLTEPAAVSIEDFQNSLCAGDQVFAEPSLSSWLVESCDNAEATRGDLPDYDATTLFDAALRPQRQQAAALEPLYLMGSYAE